MCVYTTFSNKLKVTCTPFRGYLYTHNKVTNFFPKLFAYEVHSAIQGLT